MSAASLPPLLLPDIRRRGYDGNVLFLMQVTIGSSAKRSFPRHSGAGRSPFIHYREGLSMDSGFRRNDGNSNICTKSCYRGLLQSFLYICQIKATIFLISPTNILHE